MRWRMQGRLRRCVPVRIAARGPSVLLEHREMLLRRARSRSYDPERRMHAGHVVVIIATPVPPSAHPVRPPGLAVVSVSRAFSQHLLGAPVQPTLTFPQTRQVGRTTYDIDLAVHDFITQRGAYPSPLLYKGFPRACCTSVNNVIAHGIPDKLSPPPVLPSLASSLTVCPLRTRTPLL